MKSALTSKLSITSLLLCFIILNACNHQKRYAKAFTGKRTLEETLAQDFLIGLKAPVFEAVSIGGKQLSVNYKESEFTLLVFFFIGCHPCIEEIPMINKIHNEFKNCNVISIGLDDAESLNELRAEHNIQYDIIANGNWLRGKFNPVGFPTNYLINRKGKIVDVFRCIKSDEDYLLIKKHLIK